MDPFEALSRARMRTFQIERWGEADPDPDLDAFLDLLAEDAVARAFQLRRWWWRVLRWVLEGKG
ncbi:MAG: hypothetical protein ACYCZN_01510 [Candidatus Dormibacteria bacterium]